MGGGGGKGKSETYVDVNIQNLYPHQSKPNTFQKHLLTAYQMAKGDSVGTITNLINSKVYMSNTKILEKFGFKVVTGSVNKITEYSLIAYLQQKGYKNIKVLRNLRLQYLLTGYKSADYEHGTQRYYWDFPVGEKWSFNKTENIYYNVPSNQGGNSYSVLWLFNTRITRLAETNLKYKVVDDTSLNIIKRLEDDPNVTITSDNYTYTYKDFNTTYENNITHDTVKYTYHKYKIDGTTYSLVFSGSKIDYEVNDNITKVHFKDSDGNDKWYELPKSNEKYVVFAFTANGSKEERFIVDKLTTLQKINAEYQSFFWINVKHNGSMTNVSNSRKVVLKKFGITLPKNIGDDSIREAAFTLSSGYDNDNEIINNTLKGLYGSNAQPKKVTIKTPNGLLKYEPQICKPSDGIFNNSNCSNNSHYNFYNNLHGGKGYVSFNGVSINDKDTKDYLIPIGPLKSMKLKDFYIGYYDNLASWTYMEKTIHLKWYQTMFFQIVMLAVMSYYCPYCTMAFIAEQAVLNPLLESMGFNDDQILAIDTIINIIIMHQTQPVAGTSAATTQTAATTAETTATETTIEIGTSTTATATSTSIEIANSYVDSIEQYVNNTINEALNSAEQTFDDYLTTAENWIQDQFNSFINTIENSTLTQQINWGIQAAQFGSNAYYKKRLNQDKSKVQDLQNENNIIAKKIKDKFGKRFLYEPFDELDAYDDLRWMDLFDMQDNISNTDPIDDTITF